MLFNTHLKKATLLGYCNSVIFFSQLPLQFKILTPITPAVFPCILIYLVVAWVKKDDLCEIVLAALILISWCSLLTNIVPMANCLAFAGNFNADKLKQICAPYSKREDCVDMLRRANALSNLYRCPTEVAGRVIGSLLITADVSLRSLPCLLLPLLWSKFWATFVSSEESSAIVNPITAKEVNVPSNAINFSLGAVVLGSFGTAAMIPTYTPFFTMMSASAFFVWLWSSRLLSAKKIDASIGGIIFVSVIIVILFDFLTHAFSFVQACASIPELNYKACNNFNDCKEFEQTLLTSALQSKKCPFNKSDFTTETTFMVCQILLFAVFFCTVSQFHLEMQQNAR